MERRKVNQTTLTSSRTSDGGYFLSLSVTLDSGPRRVRQLAQYGPMTYLEMAQVREDILYNVPEPGDELLFDDSDGWLRQQALTY